MDDFQKKLHLINAKKEDLKKKSKDEQRNLLGRTLMPKVDQIIAHKDLAGKITGMIVDLNQFSVDEIIAMMNNESQLKQRIIEAEDLLIKNQGK